MRIAQIVVVLGTFAGLTAAFFGCGESSRPNAADGTGSVMGGADGPCNPDGATRACRVKVSEVDGIVSCYQGTQECINGRWSSCGGSNITLTSFDSKALTSDGSGGLKPLALSTPTADGSACAANPCDPYCVAYQEDAGTQTADAAVAVLLSSNPFGNAPGGFAGKMDCSPCNTGYPKNCNGAPQHYNMFDGCQSDHRCNTSTGACTRNMPYDTWPSATCAGIDLTVGPACTISGSTGFPICNRGNTAIPAGTVVQIDIDNGNQFALSATNCPGPGSGATRCTKTVPAGGLQPGQCMRRLQGADAPDGNCNWNGNVVAFVNADRSIQECGMGAPAPPGTPMDATKPGCFNNWSDIKTGDSCIGASVFSPTTYTQVYQGTCPRPDQRPVWKLLSYDSTLPCTGGVCTPVTQSRIKFEVSTRETTYDGAVGVTTPFITVAYPPDDTPTHPAVCSMTGPAPNCPVDLYAALGPVAARYQTLTLRYTLEPPTVPLVTPTLRSWNIVYDCVDYE